MTLREILDAAAGETPGVDGAVDGEGGTTWSAGGTVFAILQRGRIDGLVPAGPDRGECRGAYTRCEAVIPGVLAGSIWRHG